MMQRWELVVGTKIDTGTRLAVQCMVMNAVNRVFTSDVFSNVQ